MKKFKSTPTKKHYGQHWLIDKNIRQKIIEAAELSASERVIEIGTGTGFLTEALAQQAGHVFSYDIDSTVQAVAQQNLCEYHNITFIHQDILEDKRPFRDVTNAKRCKLVANIPYNITTPIIEHLIQNKTDLDRVIFMVQKEIGDRLAATPGTSAYSSLSLYVQYHFQVRQFWTVSKHCFKPPPRVESALVELIPYPQPPVLLSNEDLFFKIIHAAFWGRRKTLRNALLKNAGLTFSAAEVDQALAALNIPSLERGEKLSIADFAALANELA